MSGIERTVRTKWSKDLIVTAPILESWKRCLEVGKSVGVT